MGVLRSILVVILAGVGLSAGHLHAADVDPPVSISLHIGADSVSIGDRVPLLLSITHPDSMRFLPLEGGRSTVDVHLLGGEKKEGEAREGVVKDTLLGWVVPFKTGMVTIPPIRVFYETTSGLRGSVDSDSSSVYVRSILPENAQDIRPLKQNISAPSDVASYVLLTLFACILIVIVVLAVRLSRRRRKKLPVSEPRIPSRPAHEIAFQELEKIASLNLLSQGRFKEYYTLISETLRRYIGNRFGFETLDLTTVELVMEMSERDVATSAAADFRSFLERSDLVKFSKFVPPYDEMESAIEVVRRLVEKTMARLREEAMAPVPGEGGVR